jgi:hypothetical protein
LKKRPFLLLEILIALMLVILCAIPLAIEPLRLYRSEMKLLAEIEGERLADWTFSEIKEKLLRNDIPWEDLPLENKAPRSYPLEPSDIHIPGRSKKQIQRSFTLTCQRQKEGLQGEIYRIFDVDIYFTPRLSHRKKRKNKQGVEVSDYRFKLTARQMPISAAS